MKKNQLSASIVAALCIANSALCFTSCSSDRLEGNGDEATVSVSFSTRTGDTDDSQQWKQGDAISVKQDGAMLGTLTYCSDGAKWTADGTANGSNELEVKLSLGLTAYYPATTYFGTFSIPTDQSTDIHEADLMQGESTPRESGQHIALKLDHQLAKIVVAIDEYTGYSTLPTISDVKIMSIASAVSSSNDKWTASDNTVTAITPMTTEDTSGNGKHTYTALVAPGTYDGEQPLLTLTAALENAGTGIPKTASLSKAVTLEGGKSYLFSLSMEKDTLTLNDCTIEPWTDNRYTGAAHIWTKWEIEPGQLTADNVSKMITYSKGNLRITGTMNLSDLNVISSQLTSDQLVNLNLSNIKFTEDSGTDITFNGPNTEYTNSTLKTLTLPEGITKIKLNETTTDDDGYTKAVNPLRFTALTSVTLPSTVTEISAFSFYNATNLTYVNIPENIKTIGKRAFSGSGVQSVTIPRSATLSDYAFNHCEGLKSVTFEEGCTSTGEFTFESCNALTSLYFPSGISIGRHSFRTCYGLTSVYFSEGVTEIGSWAFTFCHNITSLTISEGLKVIGPSAFAFLDSLPSVTLPSTLTTIGDYAFGSCYSLTSVTCKATTPPTYDPGTEVDKPGIFGSKHAEGFKIYVPSESVDAYKAAKGWSAYADYIEAIPQ